VKKFAVRNIDQEDQAWNHMEIPEKIGIDSYISKELRQEVTAKGNQIVGTDIREVGHIIASLNDFRMSHTVPFDEEAESSKKRIKRSEVISSSSVLS
jgi:hypothetical protein